MLLDYLLVINLFLPPSNPIRDTSFYVRIIYPILYFMVINLKIESERDFLTV